MKKIYLNISFLLLSVVSIAQDYVVSPSNSLTTTVQTNEYVSVTIYFENISSGDLILDWQLLEKIVPPGCDYSYCDFNTCYDGTKIKGTMAAFPPGNIGFMKVNIMTPNEGWAYFKFEVYPELSPETADTIEFWFNGIVGIKQIVKEEISIYPNPVNAGDSWTIKNVPSNSVVEIYNALGQKVQKTNSSVSTNLVMDLPLNKGVYFIRISHEGITENRKLIVR